MTKEDFCFKNVFFLFFCHYFCRIPCHILFLKDNDCFFLFTSINLKTPGSSPSPQFPHRFRSKKPHHFTPTKPHRFTQGYIIKDNK